MSDVRVSYDETRETHRREVHFHPADPDGATRLTREQVHQFNELGFVSPLPAFDPTRAEEVAAYFDGLLEAVLGAPDRRNAYSINAYQLVCRGIYDLILEPVLVDYAQDVLGPDVVCWGSQLFCKLPGDPKEVPLHQDAVYWPFTPTRSATVWLAVDDVDAENAAMVFAPRSHLQGALPHTERALDGTRVLKRAVSDPAAFSERFCNTLRRGEVSIHNDLLLHGSPPNRSDRRRAGFTIRYAAAEVDTVAGWEHWKTPAMHCRGSIPAHWPHRPRPQGEHPSGWRSSPATSTASRSSRTRAERRIVGFELVVADRGPAAVHGPLPSRPRQPSSAPSTRVT